MSCQNKKRAMRRRSAIRTKSDRSRLSVHRTNLHVYAQVIDDINGQTLAQASTLDKEYKKEEFKGTGLEKAYRVGEIVAKRAKEAGIEEVVYDVGSNKYHGRVAKLAEGARSGGLKF